jgi:hypothetical protein
VARAANAVMLSDVLALTGRHRGMLTIELRLLEGGVPEAEGGVAPHLRDNNLRVQCTLCLQVWTGPHSSRLVPEILSIEYLVPRT